MADLSNNGRFNDSTDVIEVTGKIMVVAITVLFFIVVFVFCLHLYAKWFWYRRQDNTTTTTTTTRRRRRRLDFAAGYQEITVVPALRRGLDPSALKTIPVIVFDPKEFKEGLECAVCLSEVSEGEKARLLPKCNHGFHVDCIDMWFQSHSTCPLCRNPVANPKPSSDSGAESRLETIPNIESSATETPPNFPTNVLIWGDETQVSTFGPSVEEDHRSAPEPSISSSSSSSSGSSSMASTSNRPDGVLVIDIPRQVNEEEDPKSPVPTRLRSLKRLLSGNRRVNPSSPRSLDLEQGGRSQI